jgi:hypothetical protein
VLPEETLVRVSSTWSMASDGQAKISAPTDRPLASMKIAVPAGGRPSPRCCSLWFPGPHTMAQQQIHEEHEGRADDHGADGHEAAVQRIGDQAHDGEGRHQHERDAAQDQEPSPGLRDIGLRGLGRRQHRGFHVLLQLGQHEAGVLLGR